LRYLKSCPRLQSLDLNSFCIDQNFARYPTSLRHLSARPKSPSDPSLENFQNLESLHLAINRQSDLKKIFATLSKLPHLQEISFEPVNLSTIDLSPYFKQIPSFKKIKLIVKETMTLSTQKHSSDHGIIFKTLENFHRFTHLSLTLSFSDDLFIWSFLLLGLKNQSELQYLKLRIESSNSFQNESSLQVLCQQISKMDKLQHLKLSFEANHFASDISNFFVVLDPIFKLKTFSFECNQLSPGDVYFSLIKMLEGSKGSLEKLKVKLTGKSGSYYYPQKEEHGAVISFFNGLVNMRKLQISDFGISDKIFLKDFTEVILQSEHLRVLRIGMIKNPSFSLAVELILKKKGLERFHYQVQGDLMKSSEAMRKISLNQVRRNNLCLESMSQYPLLFKDDISNMNW